MPAPRFAHLAATTCYSLRDGTIRPHELAVATWERGMTAVGTADRDGLYGVVRMAQACKVVGLKHIVGADLALAPDASRPGWGAPQRDGRGRFSGPGSGAGWLDDGAPRVVLIARTQHGYANLCRLVTDHHLESSRGEPHASWEQLGRRPDGLFVLLGDDSPVGRLLDAGRHDAAETEARQWMDLVGPSSVLVGVTHHRAPGDDLRARARFGLADRLGVRAVAHQAARYLRRADARVADVVAAVRKQVPIDSPHVRRGCAPLTGAPRHSTRRNAEGYFTSPAEMARVFAERPDALENTAEVADRCDVDLGLGRLRVPDFVALGGEASAVLRARCEAGVRDRYPAPGSQHRELLERELAMVDQLGLAPYFLTVAEVVDRIREKGIMVACRGSAAGSLVTYALRISDVDPIAHDLAFERFMNPYRDELPDIDIDVEAARREDIYRDLLDRYGSDRVACVCMVETFKARMAIREVGKAIGLPATEVDVIAKSFPHVRAGDVRAALAHLPEMRGLNLDRPDLKLLFDVVEKMDGLPRHVALHPSGVLLADRTLRDLVPLETSAARGAGPRASGGFAMAQFDKDDVEALGLCKLDVLAVRMLSSMSHCLDEVRRVRGVDVELGALRWDDADTYELIRSTRTIGMFQIESPGQRELVGKFQPEHLDDLVVDISLFRPGPVKGDMVGPFLQRRLGQAKVVYPHPLLERALGETYGVIVYHEQVMRAVSAVTGCDLSEADLVRRRLGDPEELPRLHTWLVSSAVERGVPADIAEALWHALAQFASFGFCKAHAAAFAVPTYRSAWLKAHCLPEFTAGLLTHDPGMYPRRLILDDARQFGVAVLGLDVNRSWRDYRVERIPADEAYELLGLRRVPPPPRAPVPVAGFPGEHAELRVFRENTQGRWRVPRGWRVGEDGVPVPPAGFDKGGDPLRPGTRFAVRLALQDVAGIDDAMVDSLLAGRPFTSVDDVRRRARLSAPVAEALCHAGAFDEVGGVTTGARTRRDVLLQVTELWSGVRRHRPGDPAKPQQLGLLSEDAAPGLSDYRPSEKVRAELEVLGIDASKHVLRFYDDLLDVLGVTRAADLLDRRHRQRVRVAGVKVATQTPPVKSGQRIIFLSLDDATGISDATFFESVHDRCAWTVFHTWLLVVEGTVHRTGRRGVSLNAERVWDLRRLMRAWQEGWLDAALVELDDETAVARGGAPDAAEAARDHRDDAPAGIAGAPGRSGLRLAPAAKIRVPRNSYGTPREPAAPSRVAPDGATWADPSGRNGNVESQDLYRLPVTDPRHPRHIPRAPDQAADDQPPRKLWHSSSGSAGG